MLQYNDDQNLVSFLLQLIADEEEVSVKTREIAKLLYKLEKDFEDYLKDQEDIDCALAGCIAVQWILGRLKYALSLMLRDASQRAETLEVAEALCCVSDSIATRMRALSFGPEGSAQSNGGTSIA